jgi:hypothetical protein
MNTDSSAIAIFSLAVGLIACGGSCLAIPVAHVLSGEIRRNPVQGLLLTVSGGAFVTLGVELILWVAP